MKFKTVVCGGTFDYFHKGHESLLKLAFSLGNKVIIGITSEAYVQNSKFKNQKLTIASFEKRKEAVLEFVQKERIVSEIEIVKIDDVFGSTLSKDLKIDAIVISEETKRGAYIINQKRQELGLTQLKISIVPFVLAEDGEPISSTRIRNGEINRLGKLYIKQSWLKEGLVLPENLRQELKEPFGELLQEVDPKDKISSSYLITVGDETSKKFNERSIQQNISVIDFKIAREEKFSSSKELGFLGSEKTIVVNNPPAHITSDLFRAISRIFKSDFGTRIVLRVIGEEDLAVLPLILFSPLDTIIYYGQPDRGLVKVVVSEDTKSKAYNFVSKLKPI